MGEDPLGDLGLEAKQHPVLLFGVPRAEELLDAREHTAGERVGVSGGRGGRARGGEDRRGGGGVRSRSATLYSGLSSTLYGGGGDSSCGKHSACCAM